MYYKRWNVHVQILASSNSTEPFLSGIFCGNSIPVFHFPPLVASEQLHQQGATAHPPVWGQFKTQTTSVLGQTQL